MTVLADHELLFLGEELLTPFDPAMVQPASIDLRLGNEFIVFERDQTIAIDLDDVPKDLGRKVVIYPGNPFPFTHGMRDHFVLHPGEFCLGVTLERVTIPDDLVARLEGRSSVGRLGLAIHVTAGYIDPGFRGPITLEMANLSPYPLILRPGRSICQLSVMRMSSPPTKPYRGRYQDAEGVESSRYGQEIGEPEKHNQAQCEANLKATPNYNVLVGTPAVFICDCGRCYEYTSEESEGAWWELVDATKGGEKVFMGGIKP